MALKIILALLAALPIVIKVLSGKYDKTQKREQKVRSIKEDNENAIREAFESENEREALRRIIRNFDKLRRL